MAVIVEFTVSDLSAFAEHRLGFLLLRDNHAIPLRGISPEELKVGARRLVPNPLIEEMKHRRSLDAIVDRLGFNGDFGTFKNEGWPRFQAFLRDHGCHKPSSLFPKDHGGCIDLHFSRYGGPQPRDLADRIFSGVRPPKRVFLGCGVDWTVWDNGNGHHVPFQAIASVKGDVDSAKDRATLLFDARHEFMGQWGFIDDKLVAGPMKTTVDKTYWTNSISKEERKRHADGVAKAVISFRDVFDAQLEGWVDVLRYNDRLVVLKAAHSGEWDLLWQNYRDEEPPQPILLGQQLSLNIADMPLSQMSESDRRRFVHFRQDAWAELEAHEAEQAFYDRGGSIEERRTARDADVLISWAEERGITPKSERARLSKDLPPEFKLIELAGHHLAFSGMVTLGSYRQMLVETGYEDRRHSDLEDWNRANETASDKEPVGLSWADAQAFCAWMERRLGVAVRLPTRREQRMLRPAYSKHYEKLAQSDFPWEHFPPRPIADGRPNEKIKQVPTAVLWSEPRFKALNVDAPDFPEDSGLATTSRQVWIADFPPRASWAKSLPIEQHHGLDFIDAWDAYEWCQEAGWISGRFWEGQISPNSWGAYKNAKVTFRLVLDIEA